jgi:hypothetical protein
MIDPKEQDLPLNEMSLGSQAQAFQPRESWRDPWTYQKETPPIFHSLQDYRAALRLFLLRLPKLTDILKDWSKN